MGLSNGVQCVWGYSNGYLFHAYPSVQSGRTLAVVKEVWSDLRPSELRYAHVLTHTHMSCTSTEEGLKVLCNW